MSFEGEGVAAVTRQEARASGRALPTLGSSSDESGTEVGRLRQPATQLREGSAYSYLSQSICFSLPTSQDGNLQ